MFIIHLVKIRFLQIFREIHDMGMLRAIFLMAAIDGELFCDMEAVYADTIDKIIITNL